MKSQRSSARSQRAISGAASSRSWRRSSLDTSLWSRDDRPYQRDQCNEAQNGARRVRVLPLIAQGHPVFRQERPVVGLSIDWERKRPEHDLSAGNAEESNQGWHKFIAPFANHDGERKRRHQRSNDNQPEKSPPSIELLHRQVGVASETNLVAQLQ